MEYPLIIVSIAVIALAVIFISLRGNRTRNAKKSKRSFDFLKRRESAVWATALVVDSKGGVTGETGDMTCMSLTLEVTPPGREPYRAHAKWLVQLSALPYVSPGSEIQVKVDARNPGIVYPGANWASYISC